MIGSPYRFQRRPHGTPTNAKYSLAHGSSHKRLISFMAFHGVSIANAAALAENIGGTGSGAVMLQRFVLVLDVPCKLLEDHAENTYATTNIGISYQPLRFQFWQYRRIITAQTGIL